MSDLDATTPRVFLARHGETEWTKNGRYTGITDLDLTPEGVKQTTSTAAKLVGHGRLIDPARLVRIWVSPRRRAKQTFNSLFGNGDSGSGLVKSDDDRVVITEDIAEWGYGDYEGMRTGEVKKWRKERGLDGDREWSIWRDGCEGGESMDQVTVRLDGVIDEIRAMQGPLINGERPADVMLVAHGLILRAFVKRWLKYPIDQDLPMIYPPGGISVLSYKNRNVEEPGFFVGLALPADN
ncbi:hypothetical protein LTR09_006016 [Extremus antarcticus]|uniref:Phosphoglycerate mutase n=1 Tax=Extremus antarcticus TaxID=702011 RepID=A0AAJ0DM97_9PEZI|nr:hypothetical protein LTR09_006016 [Extremus antarcticus]